jgi:hypothetical protein
MSESDSGYGGGGRLSNADAATWCEQNGEQVLLPRAGTFYRSEDTVLW